LAPKIYPLRRNIGGRLTKPAYEDSTPSGGAILKIWI
jgi:hypothetical protein